jgi:hypothetical protein
MSIRPIGIMNLVEISVINLAELRSAHIKINVGNFYWPWIAIGRRNKRIMYIQGSRVLGKVPFSLCSSKRET